MNNDSSPQNMAAWFFGAIFAVQTILKMMYEFPDAWRHIHRMLFRLLNF